MMMLNTPERRGIKNVFFSFPTPFRSIQHHHHPPRVKSRRRTAHDVPRVEREKRWFASWPGVSTHQRTFLSRVCLLFVMRRDSEVDSKRDSLSRMNHLKSPKMLGQI